MKLFRRTKADSAPVAHRTLTGRKPPTININGEDLPILWYGDYVQSNKSLYYLHDYRDEHPGEIPHVDYLQFYHCRSLSPADLGPSGYFTSELKMLYFNNVELWDEVPTAPYHGVLEPGTTLEYTLMREKEGYHKYSHEYIAPNGVMVGVHSQLCGIWVIKDERRTYIEVNEAGPWWNLLRQLLLDQRPMLCKYLQQKKADVEYKVQIQRDQRKAELERAARLVTSGPSS